MARRALQAQVAPLLVSPTIKGIFVNSHVEAVRRAKGPEGIARLEEAFGGSVDFRDLDDVPVRDEVRIIELANDILTEGGVSPDERAYEGGRLHYRNFSGTPLARMMFAIFPRNYRYLILHAGTIAERVFKGVRFQTREIAPREIEVVMRNNDYPLEHFQGLFQAWMDDFGYRGMVRARVDVSGDHVYGMTWESP